MSYIPENNFYKWILLVSVLLGTSMGVLDATVVNVAMPNMMKEFDVTLPKLEWVVSAYMVAFVVMLPISSWLADYFGNKTVYFVGLLLFTLGSLMCSLSTNEDFLIFSRVIEGMGSGILQPVGMTIIVRAFPSSSRGIAMGFWGVAIAASVSFGPLLGGYLVTSFSWRYIFYVNVPIGLLVMLLTWLVQREYKLPSVEKFPDWLGLFSISLFLPFLLFALDRSSAASNPEGWRSPVVLGCLFLSIIFLLLFLYASFKRPRPLLNLRLLKDLNFALGNVLTFLFGAAVFSTNLLLPLFLQNSLGYSAWQSGLFFLPVGLIQGIISPVAGRFSDRINPKYPAFFGLLLLGLSFFFCSMFTLESTHAEIAFPLYIRGLGMGLIFSPLTTVTLLNISKESMGDASSIFNAMRQIGGSLGIAVLAIFVPVQNAMTDKNLMTDAVNRDFLFAAIVIWLSMLLVLFFRKKEKTKSI